MRIAIISDTHFGDPESVLITKNDGQLNFNEEFYEKFKKAARQENEFGQNGQRNDYLILLGDIFDFAVAGYKNAYELGQHFFKRIKQDDICESIIYSPGNHDFEFWHICEYEVNVINRLENNKAPREFKWSVPAIIDDRGGKNSLELPNVSKRNNGNKKYGGLYLDKITGVGEENESNFIFAYPNIYMMTNDANILITHGQYYKAFWSLFGVLSLEVFKDDLGVGKDLNIKNLVSINFPTSQLASSGTGQAGPLSERCEFIQRTAKDKDEAGLKILKEYLDNLDDYIDKLIDRGFITEIISDTISNKLKKKIYKMLKKHKPDRYNEKWIMEPEIKKLFKSYFKSTLKEISDLNNDGYSLEIPDIVLYGHTHCPVSWGDNEAHKISFSDEREVTLYNSGGWLRKKDQDGHKYFKGAEVFIYTSEQGFSSYPIRE